MAHKKRYSISFSLATMVYVSLFAFFLYISQSELVAQQQAVSQPNQVKFTIMQYEALKPVEQKVQKQVEKKVVKKEQPKPLAPKKVIEKKVLKKELPKKVEKKIAKKELPKKIEKKQNLYKRLLKK